MHSKIISLILIFPILTIAKTPEKINFQSILRNKEETIWSNTSVSLKIGTQIWLKKNLMVNKYQNRDTIHGVIPDGLWQNLLNGEWSEIDRHYLLGNTYCPGK